MADDANNDGRERPVVLAPVSWSLTATTMDNDGPDTTTTTCLEGGVSIHIGGVDKDVTVTGPDDGIVIAAASTEPQPASSSFSPPPPPPLVWCKPGWLTL